MVKLSLYQLNSKKNSKGESPIYCRINGLDKTINLSLGLFIEPAYWDRKKSSIKNKHPRNLTLNSFIANKKKEILSIIDNYQREGEIISTGLLKALLSGKRKIEDKTIINAFDYFITANSTSYSKGTIKHYKTAKNKLKAFLKNEYLMEDISLEKVNYELLTKYNTHLAKIYSNQQNTIEKEIKRVKAVIHLAQKLQWINLDPTNNYRCKTVTTNKVILTQDEIISIENLDLTGKERLGMIRDLFLFMAYTGISYSDMQLLTINNIQIIDDKNKVIQLNRKKSKELCIIPLLFKAENFINKYKVLPSAIYNDLVFPKISNQKMNEGLKSIAESAKINKKISCHTARHSFACIALDFNVPIESISKVLGHTSIKTTQIYAKISSKKVITDFTTMATNW